MDDVEHLVESKFEKMDEQDDIHTAYVKSYKVSKKYEKLYRLATKKLSDVEFEWEEISTKFNEDNQTLEHCDLRKISWLRELRSLKQSCSKLNLSWKGLQVQSLMRCLAFRNLLLVEPV